MTTTTNLFEQVLQNANGVEEKLLGPNYPYYSNIKTPNELGMSDKGTLSNLGKDIDGLIQYVDLLVSGKSNASKTGQPLGNKFFLQTGAKCLNTKENKEEDRYIYVNNVPEGNIPFITQGMGVNFSELKGLIPGTMGNLNALNPFSIMRAFMSGNTPPCQEITLETIDIYNNKNKETHYVTLVDIQNMDPCSFTDKKNPLNGQTCKETFTNYHQKEENINLPNDLFIQLYLYSLASIMIYVFYCIFKKK
jgi:hypothetical protein